MAIFLKNSFIGKITILVWHFFSKSLQLQAQTKLLCLTMLQNIAIDQNDHFRKFT